jgi:hypothetical protein
MAMGAHSNYTALDIRRATPGHDWVSQRPKVTAGTFY